MSGKKIKALRKRCHVLWATVPLLRLRYGVGGFDTFYKHAKKDAKAGDFSALEGLEKIKERQEDV